MGGLSAETIAELKRKVTERDRASARADAKLDRQMESERRRRTAVLDSIATFNRQVETDPELQRALEHAIDEHPDRKIFEPHYSGVVVSEGFGLMALLTEQGIESFAVHRESTYIGCGSFLTVERLAPKPLNVDAIGYLFPSGETATQEVEALLSPAR